MATRKQIAIGCRECSGRGYMISSENGQYARAEICGCVSECSSCRGSGAVFLENERGYRYLERCGLCGITRLKVRRYNNAKIPSKYAGVLRSDDMDPSDSDPRSQQKSQYVAMDYVKSFVDKYPEKKGFLLMGGPERCFWRTKGVTGILSCLLYTSPSPRDRTRSRMPSSA